MQDLTEAWQRVRPAGGTASNSGLRGVRMLIEAWNHNFFLRRAVYFRFSKVRTRRHRRTRSRRGSRYGSDEEQDYSDEDSDSMSSEEEEEDDYYDENVGGRYDRSRKRSSRRRRDKEATYRLLCEFITPSGGGGRGGLPSGYHPNYA